ncbi:MAG TPA: hydrogenase expression/formation protein HypE [Firmicutes bacterium]|jgi:hydrogenase expression/formation protein HypE|nr:hydrogenase expression/formation protein HypE [Bacillota bacterium]
MTELIKLGHGAGGLLTARLIREVFLRRLPDQELARLNDSALLPLPTGDRLAFTTDGFVVDPYRFPGGDIGKLAVYGSVNDLAVMGATPLYLSTAYIIEEGFPITELTEIVDSLAEAAEQAGVKVVTGDTKVVERGGADGIFITTAGVGIVPAGVDLSAENVQPGDVVIVNGPIGEHGIAVLSQREGLKFETPVLSDCAPLNTLLQGLPERFPGIRYMRDATRGGVATVVKEMAVSSGTDIFLVEDDLPVRPAVAAACELLGLDPLYLANEGRVVMVVDGEVARDVLAVLQAHPLGAGAAIIGQVTTGAGNAFLRTGLGGTKFLDLLVGEQLPRIC